MENTDIKTKIFLRVHHFIIIRRVQSFRILCSNMQCYVRYGTGFPCNAMRFLCNAIINNDMYAKLHDK